MKIGELAKLTGCSVQTIRYYEKQNLLESTARSEGNFRLYDTSAVLFVRLSFFFNVDREPYSLVMSSELHVDSQPLSRSNPPSIFPRNFCSGRLKPCPTFLEESELVIFVPLSQALIISGRRVGYSLCFSYV